MRSLKKTIVVGSLLLANVFGYSQSLDMHNHGVLQVEPNGLLSVKSNFYNSETGEYENNGEVIFAGDFNNDGITTFNPNHQGYTRFQGLSPQQITGSFPADFYDVLFQNNTTQPAFLLSADIAISGNADFMAGIVYNTGNILFLSGATHTNTDHNSHIDGLVQKAGAEMFRYPIGNGGFYRFSEISANGNLNALFSSQYHFENSDPLYPHSQKEETIQFIDNTEYWELYKEDDSEDVLLTLSWDEATTPSQITNSNTIHIIRWDTNENRWISEGGVIDYETKTVTTIAQVGGYGVFTLAASDEDLPDDDDLIIYNGVSPNDDGDNDYFEIENIQKYPENRVVIFNRWGIKVFETTNYDSRDNVFKGYSDARATLGSGLLPTGTYFYILEYIKTTTDGNSKKIKRSGHLYLKTD